MKPKVKICCISSIQEAQLAIQAGATELGLVGPMPSGPGIISNETIAEIAKAVPSHINTFLLTSETTVQGIIDHHAKVGTNTIQIVDQLTEGSHSDIRAAIPGIKLVQVIHVIDRQSVLEAQEAAEDVDCILLDSGNPNKAVKELGGTGRRHNWDLSKEIVDTLSIPVFLAGGLRSENVREAIEKVGSYGLDLCSGVRENGNLDPVKLKVFFDQVNA